MWRRRVGVCSSLCLAWFHSWQADRLGECAVAGGVPGGEANPFLPGSVERNSKAVRAEWRLVRRRNDFAVRALAIVPNDFDKLQRKSPLHLRHDCALAPASLNRPACNQNLSRRDKEVAGAQGAIDGTPVVERRHAV